MVSKCAFFSLTYVVLVSVEKALNRIITKSGLSQHYQN